MFLRPSSSGARPEARCEIFNLTCGRSRSINELIDVLRPHFPELEIASRPRPRLMPRRGTLCVDKARALIGYDPQYPLERGMNEYVRWYRGLDEALTRGEGQEVLAAVPA